MAEQVDPQAILPSVLVTAPSPAPAMVTVRVGLGGGAELKVAVTDRAAFMVT